MQNCRVDHPALPALFDPALPDYPVLWAVLKGRNAGSALVDSLSDPAECVLRTDACLTYFSRGIGQHFLAESIPHFRRSGAVWLVWPDEASPALRPPEGADVARRFAFSDCDPRSPILSDLRRGLPQSMQIQTIDRHLLERCEWRAEMEFYSGSLENFLANGMSLCLMHRGEILSEAYASSLGASSAEIGAITHKA